MCIDTNKLVADRQASIVLVEHLFQRHKAIYVNRRIIEEMSNEQDLCVRNNCSPMWRSTSSRIVADSDMSHLH
ncbi:hypothetical protein BDW02DRAFT_382600 [Decorospora gaudefroyi]|uniref:PIN domain-containing protein n=1 Tax=Decorospora gaudefroyi TaxID=184978 RepID=A0A6A5K6Q5_9PLEO|nr:hypothetical protein BDW02DRAFT_382600 [Decorospora gaudefroyi]